MKLTNEIRDNIIKAAIHAKFEKEESELQKVEIKLAQESYDSIYDSNTRRKVNSLDAKWFRQDTCLRFNVRGQHHQLTIPYESRSKISFRVPHSNGCGTLGVLEGEIGEKVYQHAINKEAIKTQKNEAHNKLRGLLYSITTYKRLAELWPEGKKFYKMYDEDQPIKSQLPAIQFGDINKMLGLEKQAA